MPSQALHYLVSRAAREAIGLLGMQRETAFNIGCQGPDIFSHNRRTKPYSIAFARLLHRKDYGRFCANLASRLVENPSVPAESWFLGFVTHQCVDRAFHPYIVYRSYMGEPNPLPAISPPYYHAFFERILDAELYRAITGKGISSFDTDAAFQLDEDETREISAYVAFALIETYPDTVTDGDDALVRTRNAFDDAIYFYRVTNPSVVTLEREPPLDIGPVFSDYGASGTALLFPERLSREIDWLNLERGAWRDPVSGEGRNDSARDLYRDAIERSVGAIVAAREFLEGLISREALEGEIGNQCLSVCGPDGSVGQVRFAEPFDLGSALLDQVELRRKWLSS